MDLRKWMMSSEECVNKCISIVVRQHAVDLKSITDTLLPLPTAGLGLGTPITYLHIPASSDMIGQFNMKGTEVKRLMVANQPFRYQSLIGEDRPTHRPGGCSPSGSASLGQTPATDGPAPARHRGRS